MNQSNSSILQRFAKGETIQISDMIDFSLKTAGALINTWHSARIETAQIEIKRRQLAYEHEQILEALRLINEERTGLFREYFDRLDKAMEKGDTEIASSLLSSIRELAVQAPFAALQDIRVVKMNLEDPDHEWEI